LAEIEESNMCGSNSEEASNEKKKLLGFNEYGEDKTEIGHT
jgi:hypothetical protein